MDVIKFFSSLCLYIGIMNAMITAADTGNIGAWICAGALGLAIAINNRYI